MSNVNWVEDATGAFESALADLIGEHPPTLDPREVGRRGALRAVSGAVWADTVGPFFDTDGVMELLGGVSKQAVHDRVRRHRLLALRTGSGRLVYPAAQFEGSGVIRGLSNILDVILPDDTEAWMVASWLTTPDSALEGRSPLDALRSGEIESVVSAAKEVATSLRG